MCQDPIYQTKLSRVKIKSIKIILNKSTDAPLSDVFGTGNVF